MAEPSTAAITTLGGRRVLVTGGAGVIAGELLARLSRAGASVMSVDRLPLAAPPPGVEHVRGDLAEMDLRPLASFKPEHVLHLAATFERSRESPEFWSENWNDNVVASHRIVELAEMTGGVETFVFASSYLVYDPRQYLRDDPPTDAVSLDEESRLLPRNLCGSAKLYAEAEIEFQRRVRGLDFRSIHARIYRVYGRGSRDVVSRWVRAGLAGEAIEVYHPENRFDYVFAGDVAEGLLRLAASPRAEGVVNLASGRARPVSDVIAAIEAATGRRLELRTRDADEPFEASQADVTRLRELTGWAPGTSLEAGVRLLVDFERGRTADAEPGGPA
jgi:nucleoside-diphosphate-sugar epimerase